MPDLEKIIFVGWAFLIGGVIGSFMNVVVYRVPHGLSLIEPPSHCPKCKHRIRWYHNLPIFGWLVLRGKCRDCGQPISPRYPLVELTVAVMFAIIMAVEFTLQGMNLPRRESLEKMFVWSNAELYLIVVYHLILLSVLMCGAMMEFDRNRPPVRMYHVTILLGLIFPLQWTLLRPMKAWPDEPTFMAGGIDGLIGLAVGGTLGYFAQKIQGAHRPRGMPLGLACVGVFLGWQAVLPVGILAAILAVVAATVIPGKRQAWLLPASVWLWILTFFWILFWSPLVSLLNLP
jgi:leader peptidase (prepilin peptidase)/N-methyltransferase